MDQNIKISELTVEELKDIIKEVVKQELDKVYMFPSFNPYYVPPYKGHEITCPYKEYRITYTDHTEELK